MNPPKPRTVKDDFEQRIRKLLEPDVTPLKLLNSFTMRGASIQLRPWLPRLILRRKILIWEDVGQKMRDAEDAGHP